MLLPPSTYLPRRPIIQSRQNNTDGQSNATRTVVIVLISLVAIAALPFFLYILLAFLRRRYENPRYVPTQYLKSKWRAWRPRSWSTGRPKYPSRLHENDSAPTLYLRSADRSARTSAHLVESERRMLDPERSETEEVHQDAGASVERNTSVRSVMTLPAYSKSVRENEQVLGREGERGGIDVVIEAAETAEEEEGRREEEMESLYQIRQQRRREIANREDRRQRRREARERGDVATLQALRQESQAQRAEREITGASAMIAEHQSHSRDRRISSVSYGDLGVARHDGTRLRASSTGSDRQPLLDSAASMSGRSARQWAGRDSLSTHTRDMSTSSAISAVSSDVSDSELEMPPFGRAGSDFEVVTLNHSHSRNPSRSTTPIGRHSRASSNVPSLRPSVDTTNALPRSEHPPAYDGTGFEEAPPYTSPIQTRAPQPVAQQQTLQQPQAPQLGHIRTVSASGAPLLPEIGRLPSIRIAEATPIEPREPQDFPSSSQARGAG